MMLREFHHQNTFLDAFRTNSRNIIGRNPSMVIPLLANQDLTPMLVWASLEHSQGNVIPVLCMNPVVAAYMDVGTRATCPPPLFHKLCV